MIYDRTCRGWGPLPGLTHSWIAGGWLYRALGRLDAYRGFERWSDALEWLAGYAPERPISEVQYWGHGTWGTLLMDRKPLDRRALRPGHPLSPLLRTLRSRLCGARALWWFRTCETFGARPGHDFARAWVDFFGTRAAGHTFIIGPWQSGLHSLGPGEAPGWSETEGLKAGRPEEPVAARWSGPGRPHTITCFHGAVPPGW
ncbi:MAG: hypothetical protein D6729_09150 [Deltaproteobacteria bacterium]|nr:MAG: hypothetical protein D6729_09150 [Deltaproteobacteria bacterium]